MRIIARQTVGWLILGVIANIAVTWACALHRPKFPWHAQWYYERIGEERWASWVLRTRVGAEIYSERTSRSDVVWARMDHLESASLHTPRLAGLHEPLGDCPVGWEVRGIEAYGWPMLSMWCEHGCESFVDPKTGLELTRIEGGINTPLPPRHGFWGDAPVALPYRPVFPGVLVNTMLFAAMPWLLWHVPRGSRRSWRRLGGRCPRCGYDLRGTLSLGCPECGWRRETRVA